MGYVTAVAFLASSALMVGFVLFLGYLNYRDQRNGIVKRDPRGEKSD